LQGLHQPADNQVQHRDPENVALLELLKYRQMKQRVVGVGADLALETLDLARQGWGGVFGGHDVASGRRRLAASMHAVSAKLKRRKPGFIRSDEQRSE
jgi:hypothetical protein